MGIGIGLESESNWNRKVLESKETDSNSIAITFHSQTILMKKRRFRKTNLVTFEKKI